MTKTTVFGVALLVGLLLAAALFIAAQAQLGSPVRSLGPVLQPAQDSAPCLYVQESLRGAVPLNITAAEECSHLHVVYDTWQSTVATPFWTYQAQMTVSLALATSSASLLGFGLVKDRRVGRLALACAFAAAFLSGVALVPGQLGLPGGRLAAVELGEGAAASVVVAVTASWLSGLFQRSEFTLPRGSRRVGLVVSLAAFVVFLDYAFVDVMQNVTENYTSPQLFASWPSGPAFLASQVDSLTLYYAGHGLSSVALLRLFPMGAGALVCLCVAALGSFSYRLPAAGLKAASVDSVLVFSAGVLVLTVGLLVFAPGWMGDQLTNELIGTPLVYVVTNWFALAGASVAVAFSLSSRSHTAFLYDGGGNR